MSDQYDYAFEYEWAGAPYGRHGIKPVRTSAPAVPPVTLAEIKRHCRVDHDDDNADLQDYLDTAIEQLDGYSGILGRALVNQSWRQPFPCFSDVMRLPLEPLQSVTSVSYYDGDNATQTLSAGVYDVLTDDRGPFVALKAGQSWPTTYERRDAVNIVFVAGYGAAASDVPARLRQAIKLHAADLYAGREATGAEQRYSTMTYERLIKPLLCVY